jgi:hypothetical protein
MIVSKMLLQNKIKPSGGFAKRSLLEHEAPGSRCHLVAFHAVFKH